jgi:hypothetical protein
MSLTQFSLGCFLTASASILSASARFSVDGLSAVLPPSALALTDCGSSMLMVPVPSGLQPSPSVASGTAAIAVNQTHAKRVRLTCFVTIATSQCRWPESMVYPSPQAVSAKPVGAAFASRLRAGRERRTRSTSVLDLPPRSAVRTESSRLGSIVKRPPFQGAT